MKREAVGLCCTGLSMNASAKRFGGAARSVLRWVRGHADRHCPRPEPEPGTACVVERDEVWRFVEKAAKLWIWQALARPDGRPIDRECGGRDGAALERLLKRLDRWGVRLYCTDDGGPFDQALPVGRRYVGKDETGMSERTSARLRHWFARFRRRTTVAVSRSAAMVDRTVAPFARCHCNGAPFGPALVG